MMNHTDRWMGGRMGGGMGIWAVIGVAVVAQEVENTIVKIMKEAAEADCLKQCI